MQRKRLIPVALCVTFGVCLMPLRLRAGTQGKSDAGSDATAKARALVDLLAERKVDVRTGASPELLQRERELMTLTATQALRLRELKMRGGSSPEAIRALETKLLDNEAQLQVVQVQLRGSRYATLQYPQPITVAEAQKLLPPDTAL